MEFDFKNVSVCVNNQKLEIGDIVYLADEISEFTTNLDSMKEYKLKRIEGKYFTGTPVDDESCLDEDEGVFAYFVRKPFKPLNLNDSTVRDRLRNKWIKSRDGKREFSILCLDYDIEAKEFTANGFTAEYLANNFTFLDGSPIGEYYDK